MSVRRIRRSGFDEQRTIGCGLLGGHGDCSSRVAKDGRQCDRDQRNVEMRCMHALFACGLLAVYTVRQASYTNSSAGLHWQQKNLSADISTTMAAAAAAAAVEAANLALWLALEIEGWRTPRIASGASTVPSRERPIVRTRSIVWNRDMTAAERAAAATAITNFRNSQVNINNVQTNSPIPPVPGDLNDQGAAQAYLTPLQNQRAAFIAARQVTVQLRTIREAHRLPTMTVTLLQSFENHYLAEENRIVALITQFQAAVVAEAARRAAAGLSPQPSEDGGQADGDGGRLPPRPNHFWYGGWPLRPGGQSQPVVYVRQSRTGYITDRVCVKDTAWPRGYTAVNPNATERHVRWNPDFVPASNNHYDKQPAEVGALEKISNIVGKESIVQMRGWHKIWHEGRLRWYRTYQEWCGYGDIYQLSRKYQPYLTRNRVPSPPVTEQDWLPEAFLWSVFESLARAGRIMSRGAVAGAGPADWSQIIHADLKPMNVFLGENTSGLNSGYPLAKIGDFGCAMIIPHDATRGRPGIEYMHWGTNYCHAPEQQVLNADGTHNLSEATNVWQVGITMWALLHSDWSGGPNPGSPGPYTPPTAPNLSPRARNPMTATFPPAVQAQYGIHLMSTILRCLRLDPTQRYNFDDILRRCLGSQIALSREKRVRLHPRDDGKFFDNVNGLKLNEERWPLRARLTNHWYDLGGPNAPIPPRNVDGGGVVGMGPLPPNGTDLNRGG